MLSAESTALQRRLVLELATLRQQELNYLIQRYQSVGTQAALVGGFSISLLTQVSGMEPNPTAPVMIVHAFYICSYTSMLASIHTVIVCLFCSNWAPGLALRGPSGSMTRALDAARMQRTHVDKSFVLSLIAFTVQVFSGIWILALDPGTDSDRVDALLSSLLIIIAAYYTRSHVISMHTSFYGEVGKMAEAATAPPAPPAWSSRRGETARPSRSSFLRRASAPLLSSDDAAHSEPVLSNKHLLNVSLDNPFFAIEGHPELSLRDPSEARGEGGQPPPRAALCGMHGILTKRIERRGLGLGAAAAALLTAEWRERYFVLCEGCLLYWHSHQAFMMCMQGHEPDQPEGLAILQRLTHATSASASAGTSNGEHDDLLFDDLSEVAPSDVSERGVCGGISGRASTISQRVKACAATATKSSFDLPMLRAPTEPGRIELRSYRVVVDLYDGNNAITLQPDAAASRQRTWHLRAASEELRLQWAEALVTAINWTQGQQREVRAATRPL